MGVGGTVGRLDGMESGNEATEIAHDACEGPDQSPGGETEIRSLEWLAFPQHITSCGVIVAYQA